MTRRIALAILLTVWATLIAGCITAYITVRWALIQQLDDALQARASAIPELSRLHSSGETGRVRQPAPGTIPSAANAGGQPQRDRYVLKTSDGRSISPPAGGVVVTHVERLSAQFVEQSDGDRLRVLSLRAHLGDTPVTITYQASADQVDRLLDRLALLLGCFGLSAGLIAAMVAVRVSRAALRPLQDTALVLSTIDHVHLDRRIDASRLPRELVPVAGRLNEMLDRIEQAYAQRQRFMADASHELRTPVAALVTTAEVALRYPRDQAAYRTALETCRADATLLRRLVERLMEQCRADTPTHDEEPVETNLSALLNHCADQAQALGAQKNLRVARRIPPGMTVTTQPQRLRSIVTNLLANAVEYTQDGGTVEIRAQAGEPGIDIVVQDNGPGIPAEHLPHIFEPFYRADRMRSDENGHLGLGLSLVQSHVHALRGIVSVTSREGTGTSFSVRLPAKCTIASGMMCS